MQTRRRCKIWKLVLSWIIQIIYRWHKHLSIYRSDTFSLSLFLVLSCQIHLLMDSIFSRYCKLFIYSDRSHKFKNIGTFSTLSESHLYMPMFHASQWDIFSESTIKMFYTSMCITHWLHFVNNCCSVRYAPEYKGDMDFTEKFQIF